MDRAMSAPIHVNGEAARRQMERKLKRSVSAEEAISIVDQMLAGAIATKDQLAAIKFQLSKEPQEWLSEVEDGDVKDSLLHMVLQKVPLAKAPLLNSLPKGTTPAMCLPPKLRMAFVRASMWEMPVWEIDRITNGRPLSAVVLWICDELDLYDPLRLNPGTMRRFISRIEDQYRNNPYHNRQHAATVTLTMYQILVHSGTPDEWQGTNQVKLYHLAAILAAAVHDVGHPGVGNDFRVRTGDPAALLYHDMYVNENDHLATAFRIMKETGVLGGLEADAYRIVRAVMIDMVLKTDMSVHFEVVAKFQTSLTSTKTPHEMKMAQLSFFLKCSDLAHTCFTWKDHVRWVKMLQEEFHKQGELEKNLGIPNSPLTNRDKSLGLSQAKFFEALVIPLYAELAKVYPQCKYLLNQALTNKTEWENCGGVIPQFQEAPIKMGSPLRRAGGPLNMPPLKE